MGPAIVSSHPTGKSANAERGGRLTGLIRLQIVCSSASRRSLMSCNWLGVLHQFRVLRMVTEQGSQWHQPVSSTSPVPITTCSDGHTAHVGYATEPLSACGHLFLLPRLPVAESLTEISGQKQG